MLQKVDLDAGIIASPQAYHCEHIMSCFERGLHVLTEKPIVNKVAQAELLVEAAEGAGRLLMIAYQHHYSPIF